MLEPDDSNELIPSDVDRGAGAYAAGRLDGLAHAENTELADGFGPVARSGGEFRFVGLAEHELARRKSFAGRGGAWTRRVFAICAAAGAGSGRLEIDGRSRRNAW